MSDRVSEMCQKLNADTAAALRGVAQPLADEARKAGEEAECLRTQVASAVTLLNGSDVASRGEIEREPGLVGKVKHLRFIAEAAERAEAELREEVHLLRNQLAETASLFSECACRCADALAS